jgi:enoyl-CoA hydratase
MALVDFDTRGHVALITLNRPDARNAINPEVAVRLADAWQRVKDDDDIRVAVLTGTGSAFCAGADLGQLIPMMSGARKPENEWDERVVADPGITSRALLRNFDTEKPVIAAINGHAIAGGMEIVQGTDIRVSVPSARFGVQEVKWAIFPAGGSTVRLPVQIPYAKAMEIAEKVAGNGPLAVKAIRTSVKACLGQPEADAMKIESRISGPVFQTEDAKEGPRAFMEKRKPEYQGR